MLYFFKAALFKDRNGVHLIELKEVSYSYPAASGRGPALKGVSLKVESGEFIAVLGKNGSGKSTLALLLTGLGLPSEGEVLLDGSKVETKEDIFELRKSVGLIFQNPDGQIVATTVEDDVAFGPENLGLSSKEIRERVDEAIGRVGLSGLELAEPHLLSGGEKQRLAIAGALAMKPRLLLLDEATSMLDPKGRERLFEILRREREEAKRGVILITHRLEEAALAERIIALSEGHIECDLCSEEFLQDAALIERLGLDLPFALKIRLRLKEAGIRIPEIKTLDELAEAICSLR